MTKLTREQAIQCAKYAPNIMPDGVPLHLGGVDLSDSDLSGIDLSGVILSGVNFTRTSLENADLSKSNLFMANLGITHLAGANLTGANMPWVSWPIWDAGLNAKVDDEFAARVGYLGIHYLLQRNAPGITQELLDWINDNYYRTKNGYDTKLEIEK